LTGTLKYRFFIVI